MAKMVEKRHVHCSRKFVDAFVVKWDNESSTVKCSLQKACGDSCPYLKDPNYVSSFKRAPQFKPSNVGVTKKNKKSLR